MKKYPKLMSLILALNISLISVNSFAGIGLISLLGGPAGVVILKIGGVVTAAGFATMYAGDEHAHRTRHTPRGEGDNAPIYIGVIAFFAGLIILDKHGYTDSSFAPVSHEEAQSLGLTENEEKSYGAELNRISALDQSVSQALIAKGNPNQDDAKNLWAKNKDLVSADAYSAMVKISQAALKKANE